jgi:hypothetical protein
MGTLVHILPLNARHQIHILQELPASLSVAQMMLSSSVAVPGSVGQDLIGRGLVKNKQGLAVRMSSLKDLDGRSYLIHKLFGVLPRISICTWINYFSSVPDDLTFFIQEHKSPIFFINEI